MRLKVPARFVAHQLKQGRRYRLYSTSLPRALTWPALVIIRRLASGQILLVSARTTPLMVDSEILKLDNFLRDLNTRMSTVLHWPHAVRSYHDEKSKSALSDEL